MASNPINLAVRFLLEVAGLITMGVWGWNQGRGVLRFVLALGIPVIAAAIWGTFGVANDRPSGRVPVPIPGMLRLGLELVFFGFAVWALYRSGAITLSWIFGVITVLHYLLSFDRVLRLLKG